MEEIIFKALNLLRSEDIHLVKLAMTKNSAYDIMQGLGRLDALQMIDLNKSEQVYNLAFSLEIKQCHEVDRKLQVIKKACQDYGVKMVDPQNV